MKKIARIIFCLCLLLLFNLNFNAQPSDWVRVESDTKDLSVSFPNDFIIHNDKKDKEPTRIFGFKNGVVMELHVLKEMNPKDRLGRMTFAPDLSASEFTKNKFQGKMAVSEESRKDFHQIIYLASNKNLYHLEVSAPDKGLSEITRFLLSIKIDNEALYKGNLPQPGLETVKTFTALPTSPEIIEANARKADKTETTATYKKLSEAAARDFRRYSRAPIVLDSSYPNFRASPSGNKPFFARAEVKLLANGQVGDVVIYSDSNSIFTEACAKAARKIKFIPAQINGQNVDSVDIVEYHVRIQTAVMLIPGMMPNRPPF